jgi:hypothetical protein
MLSTCVAVPGVVQRGLGLRVFGKFGERQVGIAEQLIERGVALLAGELRLQLGRHHGGFRGIDVGAGACLRIHQRALAVDVALLQFDVFLGERGQRVERLQIRLQLVVVAARGIEVALGCFKRQAIGLGVECEQHVARLDVLAFDHGDPDDLAGDVGRDQHLLRADIGVVGGDVAPAQEIEGAAERGGDRRHGDQQHHAQALAVEPLAVGAVRRLTGGLFARPRLGLGGGNDLQALFTHDALTLCCSVE